ncbi:MAG: sodium transporter, partial [Mucilaginibacter polytrichastri]|nr:sodium transporter [Mucilaginibacter polytrichastri]
KQNKFGLQVIAGSLVFVALMLFALSFFTTNGALITGVIGGVVLLGAIIPWSASKKIHPQHTNPAAETVAHTTHL